jgi:uncharacterized protein (DUF305 family)
MRCSCSFSADAEEYLQVYYNILDEMIRGMTEVCLTDSVSYNFIVQMIPHHEAAIRMSENILSYTTNETLRDIASGIITEQTQSIEDMRRAMACCETYRNGQECLCSFQNEIDRILHVMFDRMQHACATNRLNCDFMWEMIPHHQGAIQMSALTLRYDICPDLIPILEAILVSQKRGVRRMRELLCELGCGSR